MPLHSYKCDECGFTDEYITGKTSSSDLPECCPKCKKGNMEKNNSWTNWGKHTQSPVPGSYQHERRIQQINNAIANPNTTHNTNPY